MTAIDVIPIANLPRGKDCYSYTIPAQRVLPGQLVKIPFRRKRILGIVWSKTAATASYAMREVIDLGPRIITNEQIDLIQRIIGVYGGSRSHMLHALVSAQRSLVITPIKRVRRAQSRLLYIQSSQRQQRLLQTLVASRGQSLVLAPTADSALRAQQILQQKTSAVLLTPQTSAHEHRQILERLQQGEKCTVVGTRRSLLLPWNKLVAIALIDEHHPAHVQWDLEPRIDNRIAASWLAEIWGAKLVMSSPLPTLATYTSRSQVSFDLDPAASPNIQCWPEPTDMGQQWCAWLTNQIVAGRSIKIVASPLKTQHAMCATCHTIAHCGTCDRPLQEQDGQWRCSWCNQPRALPACGRCKGLDYRTLPSGPDLIRKTIERYLPDISTRQYKIVQPSSILSSIEDQYAGPVSILYWDMFGSVPGGYTQAERGAQIVALLNESAQQHPEYSMAVCNVPLQWMIEPTIAGFQQWYSSEIQARTQFRYPPAYPMVLLDRHRQKRDNSPDLQLSSLRQIAMRSNAELLGPYESRTRRKGFVDRTVVLIRSNMQQSLSDFCGNIVPHIPTGWSITPNPDHLPRFN
ncbi:hypothetical protein HZA86_00110 [Candidatus Uhrbacteria bacterium]|nr:hypothetical protein [Candidatus Uhrbacteria bacterium]